MSTSKEEVSNLKIHTGFRLSQDNFKLLESLEKDLGINKTGVVNMILSLIDKDKDILVGLIKTAIQK